MLRALLFWALLPFGMAIHAQPAPAGGVPEAMPFVAASGVVERQLKYSDLIAALGEPTRDMTQPISWENGKKRGENRVITYEARGLTFLIERESRKSMDPVVSTMTVIKPSTARLPNGLYIGMPQAQAMPVIERGYRIDDDHLAGYQPWVTVTDRKDDTDRKVYISFSEGSLSFMQFTTRDPPSLLQRALRLARALVPLLLVLGVGWVIHQVRGATGRDDEEEREDSPAGGILRYTVGALLLVGGLAAAGIGGAALKGGDPYARWAGLLVLLMGLGALFMTALVLSGARNRIVSFIASGVVLLVVVASVAMSVAGRLLN